MSEKVKVQELDPSTQEMLKGLFKGWEFTRFGDGSYLMPATYKRDADVLKNMAVRADDTWVVTFARSGTTWTQEMIWLLQNDFDYDTALKIPLPSRYAYVETHHIIRPDLLGHKDADPDFAHTMPSVETVANVPTPRFMKTHMPFSLLPSNLLDTAKVVVVARDPRDVAVSYYHLSNTFFNYTGDFKTFWNLFRNDLVIYGPYFSHLKEAWALRHHENMLFLFYEDMKKDLASTVRRVADFFGKEVTDEQVVKLCEHLDFENFRNNKSVNMTWLLDEIDNPNAGFVRKGKAGEWREQFDAEMAAQAQAWLRDHLAGTDLRVPHHASWLERYID